VTNRVDGILDPEPDLDDLLLHGGHRIGHVVSFLCPSSALN
jgi:hypothetical protein